MKIAICDDMKEYRESLKEYTLSFFKIKQIPVEIFEFACGKDLIDSQADYDIVFLDMELQDTNGIEVAKSIQMRNTETVILVVTSYSEYLDDAMDIHVTRYIEKPILQSRIFSSLEKAIDEIGNSVITLHLKNNQVLRILPRDVVYIEAKIKKAVIYSKNGVYVSRDSLKTVAELFKDESFAIPHNSYIVNLNYVSSYKRDEINLMEPYSDVKISVATRKQADFRRKFFNFIGEDVNE